MQRPDSTPDGLAFSNARIELSVKPSSTSPGNWLAVVASFVAGPIAAGIILAITVLMVMDRGIVTIPPVDRGHPWDCDLWRYCE